MKTAGKRTEAFTRTELVVVVAIIATMLLLFISHNASNDSTRRKVWRISCVNNLKQIGIAYRIWANDNGEKYPAAVPQTNGGWREIVNSPNAGAYAWTNYLAIGDEIGRSANVLICPADERQSAKDIAALANTNVSYFIGPGASDNYPQAILGGDRNLGPGTTSRDDYGFSPADGRGNEVTIKGPVCWSLKMHSAGHSTVSGNILLGDGSAQQCVSGNVYFNWMKPLMISTNAQGGGTNVVGVRLIFP